MVRVWECKSIRPSCSRLGCARQHYFSVCPSVRQSSVHLSVTLSPPKPLGGIQPNLLHHFPSWQGCVRDNLFPCVRRPSICPSCYLLLNHWAEFNQTCYITHSKGVREQHYFPFVRLASVHLSVTPSPPKSLGGM